MKYKIASMTVSCLLWLFLLAGIPASASDNAAGKGYTAEECMECHKTGSEESSLLISPEKYEASVHGQSLTCLECHTGIKDEEHMNGEGIEPVDCSQCHEMKKNKTSLFSRLSSFQIASHKKADFGKNYTMDNCLGCHQGTGAHGETEAINNMDCYKCHDPNIKDAMWGYMHLDTKNKSMPAVFAYICFAVLILAVLLGRFMDLVFDNFPGKFNKS
ncbi:cytochrome domain-containing protein [Desulfonema limicola]|uniref:Cytochrome domain-containing protein n=1 Tax=Desulfonema limicola TaxID=45656 RepID=A0A975B9P9_9BACT|nr:hypothetical protein [Desulfonema limicola]QTA81453.1 cytochrome domain-containing protein [Desulfonema limicola]